MLPLAVGRGLLSLKEGTNPKLCGAGWGHDAGALVRGLPQLREEQFLLKSSDDTPGLFLSVSTSLKQ